MRSFCLPSYKTSLIANLYSQAAFVFVENDSTDNTHEILRKWLSKRDCSHLICLNGLAAQEARRTARLAIVRNSYMEAVLQSRKLAQFDHLVVVDFDDVNASVISEESLMAAIRFLSSRKQNAAVFANQLPYYDIWALRQEVWCPGDCWEEVENRPAYLPKHRAMERYLKTRRLNIPTYTSPVAVQSAFGGLGIYKLDFARAARYVSLLPTGAEICEHVAFNEAIARAGGALYIFPKLLNNAPAEHLHGRLSGLSRLTADLDPRSYKFYLSARQILPSSVWSGLRRIKNAVAKIQK